MNEDFLKRGYYFPSYVLEQWEKFHAPSKDYSPSAAGAFLVWMALDAEIRERIRKLSVNPNTDKTIKQIHDLLVNRLLDNEILAYLESLGADEKARFLAEVRAGKDRLSLKK